MATSEEAQDWLAHFGVLGMHWGDHKRQPPASGISSHIIDKQAKKDAGEHARAYLNKDNKYQQRLVSSRIAARSTNNAEYAKAFAFHKPRAEHTEKVKGNVLGGLVSGGAAAYIVYSNRGFLTRALTSAALNVAAARGAKAAAPVLLAIGNKPVKLVAQGLDGIWRLAA